MFNQVGVVDVVSLLTSLLDIGIVTGWCYVSRTHSTNQEDLAAQRSRDRGQDLGSSVWMKYEYGVGDWDMEFGNVRCPARMTCIH